MVAYNQDKLISAVFITFSGNCRKALTFYQSCFGGTLQFETFGEDLQVQGYPEMPVVSGSLVSDRIIIHGSDLVHNEGRKIGNYISLFLHCKNTNDRNQLIGKLKFDKTGFIVNDNHQKLIEVSDVFDVRWLLSV